MHHRPYDLISWNDADQYCLSRHSTMFKPRDLSEWNYIDNKILSTPLATGAHFPINDKDQEGTIVWNDGTCEYCTVILWR